MGAKPSFYLKSGFSIAPAFSLNKNFDIASVNTNYITNSKFGTVDHLVEKKKIKEGGLHQI